MLANFGGPLKIKSSRRTPRSGPELAIPAYSGNKTASRIANHALALRAIASISNRKKKSNALILLTK